MKTLNTNTKHLWTFPYGSEIIFSKKQREEFELNGNYFFTSRTGQDYELRNQFGQEFYIDDEYEITVCMPDIETLIHNYIKSLTFSIISLTEEPMMHAEQIKFNIRVIEMMVNLQKTFLEE